MKAVGVKYACTHAWHGHGQLLYGCDVPCWAAQASLRQSRPEWEQCQCDHPPILVCQWLTCMSFGSASLMISISLAGACGRTCADRVPSGQSPVLPQFARTVHGITCRAQCRADASMAAPRPPCHGPIGMQTRELATHWRVPAQLLLSGQGRRQHGSPALPAPTGVSGTARRYSTMTSRKQASRSFTVLKNCLSTDRPSGKTLCGEGREEGERIAAAAAGCGYPEPRPATLLTTHDLKASSDEDMLSYSLLLPFNRWAARIQCGLNGNPFP